MQKSPSSSYPIRFSDCDLFGHLNNARYIDYFLNAREDHLKNIYQLELKDFYRQGISWFVGSHEISYLRPADYSEIVNIQTSLLQATEGSLLVEMVMTDENQTHIKSVLWTRFIPVSIKTGKRENHPETFMAFAKSIERPEVTDSGDTKSRLAALLNEMKQKTETAG